MEKIFKQKNFNNFVWAPLGSRATIYINFCLQVHFKVSAAWYCSHYLPPVLLIPVAICHRCQKHKGNWWQNLPPVSLIPAAICHRCRWHRLHRCRWHRWCTLTCEHLREFSKKFETVLMGYSGAGGKLIHKKNQKQKISWHCPFKVAPQKYLCACGYGKQSKHVSFLHKKFINRKWKKLEFIWQPWKRFENLLVSWADFTAVPVRKFYGWIQNDRWAAQIKGCELTVPRRGSKTIAPSLLFSLRWSKELSSTRFRLEKWDKNLKISVSWTDI